MIMASLPILCWISIALTFNKKGFCWRSSFLLTSIVWGVLLTAITEILSIFKLLTFGWLLVFWGLATVISLMVHYYSVQEKKKAETTFKFPIFLKLVLASVALIAVLTGLIALVAPPNTWDSMTYHMSRVMHWIQNQSVTHYPTHILRQIHMNPWAEFAITHFQILSGGDHLANLVQWFSMAGSLLCVTLIAKELGANHRGQVFAAVVSVAIPMGILQSSSTQTDYVITFWLACFVYFGILFKAKPDWYYAFAVGCSLGLAILTKGTAYLYALPFIAWIGFSMVKTFRWKLWKHVLSIMIVVIAINIGHYKRNLDIYGSPLGPGQEGDSSHKYSNDAFTIATLISNISRNLALHTVTPSERINNATTKGVEFLHTFLSLDINDPKTTWTGASFNVPKISFHESTDGNPLHIFFILMSIVFCLYNKSLRRLPNILPYVCSLVFVFLLFCFYLKWQPWHSRLHLPLFVLWSPVIALILSEYWNRWLANSIMIIFLVSSLPWVLCNKSRPLLGKNTVFANSRVEQYFNVRPGIIKTYENAADVISTHKCYNIGLHTGVDSWEYPLWILLQKSGGQKYRIEHINVTNASGKILLKDFVPCIVVNIDHTGQTTVVLKN